MRVSPGSCPSSRCARSCKICFGVNHVFWCLDSRDTLPMSLALAGKALGDVGWDWGTRGRRGTSSVGAAGWTGTRRIPGTPL